MAYKKETNLFERLADISGSLDKIEKTGRNSQQNYAFIEQSVVLGILRKRLSEYHIVIIPEQIEHKLVSKEKGAKVIVKSVYTIINADDPKDRISAMWYGEGDDSLDKATSKAATSSEKYFLMKLFKISDKDDPDAGAPEIGKPVAPVAPVVPPPTPPADRGPMLQGSEPLPVVPDPKKVSPAQIRLMYAKVKELGISDKDEAQFLLRNLAGRDHISEMGIGEASSVIDKLDMITPEIIAEIIGGMHDAEGQSSNE